MERNQLSEDSLTVTELKGGFGGGQQIAVMDDGTYEAEYARMKIFMDNTPWGEKKCARLYFKVTRGKYKDQLTSFKGTFFQDKETQGWIVGSKSKLGDAIRAVSGGKTLGNEHIGTKVFVVIKKNVSKKSGNPYSFVESIIPRPTEEGESVDEAAASIQDSAQTNTAAQARTAQGRNATPAPKPAAKIPAPSVETEDSLLADLTELSDFKD